MFRELVLGISRSPVLISEVQEYENQLKKDLFWQKLGTFLLAILLLLFISFALFSLQPNRTKAQPVYEVAAQGFNLSIAAENKTRKIDASLVSAQPNDVIEYTLSATNTTTESRSFTFNNGINDILEYAEIFDANGGKLSYSNIIWPEISLLPKESQSRSFIIKIKNPVPALGQHEIIKTSYDCTISNNFQSQSNIRVTCPITKYVEKITTYLPRVDVIITTLSLLVLFSLSILLTLRTNLLLKELSFIRKNFTNGAF